MSSRKIRFRVQLVCLSMVAIAYVIYYVFPGFRSYREKESVPETGEESVQATKATKVVFTKETISAYEPSYYEKYLHDPRIIKDPVIGGLESGYIKQILILENKIPADAPYLTKEKAIEICNGLTDLPTKEEKWENAVMTAFDEVAYAPDFKGGSGMTRIIYFTDETHSKEIMIAGFRVYYKDYDLPDAPLEILFDPFGES